MFVNCDVWRLRLLVCGRTLAFEGCATVVTDCRLNSGIAAHQLVDEWNVLTCSYRDVYVNLLREVMVKTEHFTKIYCSI